MENNEVCTVYAAAGWTLVCWKAALWYCGASPQWLWGTLTGDDHFLGIKESKISLLQPAWATTSRRYTCGFDVFFALVKSYAPWVCVLPSSLKSSSNVGYKGWGFCVLIFTWPWFLLTGTRMQQRDALTCLPAHLVQIVWPLSFSPAKPHGREELSYSWRPGENVSICVRICCVLWPLLLENSWQTPLPSHGSEGSTTAGMEHCETPASAALGGGRSPGQFLNLMPTFFHGFLAFSMVPGK